jgi:hypothetical protein
MTQRTGSPPGSPRRVRADDRVGLFMPNCPELVLAYFACFKLRCRHRPSTTATVRTRPATPSRTPCDHLLVHRDLATEVPDAPALPAATSSAARHTLRSSRSESLLAPTAAVCPNRDLMNGSLQRSCTPPGPRPTGRHLQPRDAVAQLRHSVPNLRLHFR